MPGSVGGEVGEEEPDPDVPELSEEPEPLEAGSAFRIRPRHVHIVENASADEAMTVVGFFTPAGTPSAAYLADATDAGGVVQVLS